MKGFIHILLFCTLFVPARAQEPTADRSDEPVLDTIICRILEHKEIRNFKTDLKEKSQVVFRIRPPFVLEGKQKTGECHGSQFVVLSTLEVFNNMLKQYVSINKLELGKKKIEVAYFSADLNAKGKARNTLKGTLKLKRSNDNWVVNSNKLKARKRKKRATR